MGYVRICAEFDVWLHGMAALQASQEGEASGILMGGDRAESFPCRNGKMLV
jgi:hypothetical protein